MQEKFLPEEISNTVKLTDKCSISFEFTGYHLPKFEIPNKEQDTYEYLRWLCYNGLKEKGLGNKKEYIDRLEYELNQIHIMDLEDYFLVVSDYMRWCDNTNIPRGQARGSSGGSLVCYLSGATNIDPLKHDLIFERFLNKGRMLIYDFGV